MSYFPKLSCIFQLGAVNRTCLNLVDLEKNMLKYEYLLSMSLAKIEFYAAENGPSKV